MAFPDTLALAPDTFERLDNGKWISSTSTADEPHYISIDNSISPDGVSSYVVKVNKSKNSPAVGLPDNSAQVHVVIKAPLKYFTQAELEAYFKSIKDFLVPANVTKLLRGER